MLVMSQSCTARTCGDGEAVSRGWLNAPKPVDTAAGAAGGCDAAGGCEVAAAVMGEAASLRARWMTVVCSPGCCACHMPST